MKAFPANIYRSPVFKKNQPDDSYKFIESPLPTGTYPFHLNAKDVIPDLSVEKMIFQMVGDTGSLRNLGFQKVVVAEMLKQFRHPYTPEEIPRFLYHLGDIVYNHGEAFRYYEQFFEPYQMYPAPVFAIAGNHDSDVNPEGEVYNTLDAFKTVFCSTACQAIPFSGKAERKSMMQPHVYWTLETPLANIIGLHSNVPKYGVITEEQRAWFAGELLWAEKQKPDKAIIVCLHHSPYSADINHGSSLPMIKLLEGVFEETGVRPDVVFSGHVHNYQRFSRHYLDGKTVPFIVAGGGGYDELHPIATLTDEQFTGDNPLFKNVHLENYCDDRHGFLKLTLEKKKEALSLVGEYFSLSHYAQEEAGDNAVLSDRFELMIK